MIGRYGRDDGRRDRGWVDVALDGVAGRWLAHEHTCPGIFDNGRGLLFRRTQAGNARFSFGTGKIGVLEDSPAPSCFRSWRF